MAAASLPLLSAAFLVCSPARPRLSPPPPLRLSRVSLAAPPADESPLSTPLHFGANRTAGANASRMISGEEAIAEFIEPGGRYELDMEAIFRLLEYSKTAKLRRLANGLPPEGDPCEDEGSVLSRILYDPLSGIVPQQSLRLRAKKVKRRLNLILRPILVLGPVCAAIASPTRSARFILIASVLLHLLTPPMLLLRAARATREPSPSSLVSESKLTEKELPLAEPSQVLTAQHTLSAVASLAVSACLVHAGLLIDAFLFLIFARFCMLLGLWYWRDLNEQMLQPRILITGKTHRTGLPRLWRLATSILCIAEMTIFCRLFMAAAPLANAAASSQASTTGV